MRNHRARWAAIGAAVAVSIGAGGLITLASAAGGTASSFTPITPCRLLDTRAGAATGATPPRTAPLGQGEAITVPARGDYGKCEALSPSATGAVLNVTIVNPTAGSFLTVWPADKDRPLASSLNWSAGQAATPNQVTTALDGSGQFSIFNNGGTVDVIVDVVGLYEPAGAVGGNAVGPPGAPGAPGAPGTPGTPGAPGKAATNVMTAAAPTIGSSGQYNAMVLDPSGNPVISHLADNGDLLLTRCDDPACAPSGDTTNVVDNVGTAESNTSLALDNNGFPVISYYDAGATHLNLAHCNDTRCAGTDETLTTVDASADVGTDSSLALDSSGFPVISYHDNAVGLKVVHCHDANSATLIGTTPDSSDPSTGLSTSLVLRDGLPIISYYDASSSKVQLLHCNDENCDGGNDPINTVALTTGVLGNDQSTDLAIDSSGNPAVAYINIAKDPAVAHCSDSFCVGTVTANALQPATSTTIFASIALDGDIPVVSYVNDADRLTVARCNDSNCVSSVNTVADNGSDLAAFTSIALDSLGNPIISSADSSVSGDSLVVTRCVDPFCNPKRIRAVTG